MVLTLQQLCSFIIHLERDLGLIPASIDTTEDLLEAVEEIWLQGTFIPFTPDQMQFFTSALYFLL